MNKKNYFDAMVIGLGITGAATLYQLSQLGITVAGIEQYHSPHNLGSSHGESRIIRQAYFETPLYVPLVQRAYEIWKSIEKKSGRKLLLENGSLMIGNKDSSVITGAVKSAELYNLPYEFLEDNALNAKFPALRTTKNTVAVLEKQAGLLYPETCLQTLLDLAKSDGALLLFNEKVLSIIPEQTQITIITEKDIYITEKIILSAGAWLNKLLPQLTLPLNIERRVVHWFKPEYSTVIDYFSPSQLPVYIWEYENNKMFYGFPDLGNGLKIANTKIGVYVDPDNLDRNISSIEIKEMEELTAQHFNIVPRHIKSSVCMYTMTPDENFIIDRHPLYQNIIIASPCSGHGFKFASAIGKILADLATDQNPDFDLSRFSIKRFKV